MIQFFQTLWKRIVGLPLLFRTIKLLFRDVVKLGVKVKAHPPTTRANRFFVMADQLAIVKMQSSLFMQGKDPPALEDTLAEYFRDATRWLELACPGRFDLNIVKRPAHIPNEDGFMYCAEIGMDSQSEMILFKFEFSDRYRISQ